MSQIFFDDGKHRYSNSKDETYISASTLVHLYSVDFEENSTYWSLYKCIQDALGFTDKKKFAAYLIRTFQFDFSAPKDIRNLYHIANYNGLSPTIMKEKVLEKKQDWKKDNKVSTTRGTKIHNEIEAQQRSAGFYQADSKVYKVLGIEGFTYLEDTKFGLYLPETIPELRLYNHKYKLAGTTDQPLFEYPYVDINDWKSNKEIKTENKWDKMKYPLNHLDDCNFNHYQIQLSLYGWMLEQFGYKPRDIYITHLLFNSDNQPTGEKIIYPMKYLKTEVENMLEHYASTGSSKKI